MKSLVIYDSVFGNTEMVAKAIGAALEPSGAVETLPVGQATAEKMRGLDILIVGSPTRGFRPTEDLAKLLEALPKDHLRGVRVAAFDTRMVLELIDSAAVRFMVSKGGYAAGRIAKTLEKKGGKPAVPPEGFFVNGEKGPLKDGELERAAGWARGIVSACNEK